MRQHMFGEMVLAIELARALITLEALLRRVDGHMAAQDALRLEGRTAFGALQNNNIELAKTS